MTMSRRQLIISSIAAAGIATGEMAKAEWPCTRVRREKGRLIGQQQGMRFSNFPDPTLWKKLRQGMAEAKVLAILGPPHEREYPMVDAAEKEIRLYRWSYGILPIDSPLVPCEYRFDIFLHDGCVYSTEQPFDMNDATILNGLAPSRPRIVNPSDNQVFEHYPRLVDFRWQPAVGCYPMRYQIEISNRELATVFSGDDLETSVDEYQYRISATECVGIPYYCLALSGKQAYRWRIKAINRYGESDWTVPATFTFNC